VTRSYRLERWITAILFSIFIIPFVAEAESFYAAIAQHSMTQKPQAENPTIRYAAPASCPLPEDAVDNPIDRDPTEAELDGECC
jgi:hypothetical protein